MALYVYGILLFAFSTLYYAECVHFDTARLRHSLRHAGESLTDTVDNIAKAVQRASQSPQPDPTGCKCIKYDCGCCVHMRIKQIHVDDTGCVNVTYLPKDYGMSFTFSLNNRIIINQTISARNPPPICVGIPHLQKELSACIDFYDLHVNRKQFTGCVKVGFRLIHVISEDFKLGCFRIPLPGNQSEEDVRKLAQALEKVNVAQLRKRKSLKYL